MGLPAVQILILPRRRPVFPSLTVSFAKMVVVEKICRKPLEEEQKFGSASEGEVVFKMSSEVSQENGAKLNVGKNSFLFIGGRIVQAESSEARVGQSTLLLLPAGSNFTGKSESKLRSERTAHSHFQLSRLYHSENGVVSS